MLKIRLQRVGRKHEPVFRLVAVDSHRGPKSGRFIEILGNFDARRGEKAQFKSDRISHWLSKGAKTSDTVHNLLVSRKIIEGKKINVLPRKKPIKKEESQPNPENKKEVAAETKPGKSEKPAPEEVKTEPFSPEPQSEREKKDE